MRYIDRYFKEAREVIDQVNKRQIEKMINILKEIRKNKGRIFFLGVGGGAANSSHAVNDFRKLCGFEAYAPTDNVSELSARVNDDGWETVFVNWLKQSKLKKNDCLFIFSVGGGSLDKNISPNIVKALEYANNLDSKILGIVGRDGGYTAKVADACVIIPTINPDTITPHTESFQSVIWHLIVSHPDIKECEMKWESIK
jgi:D-sedoheptulose 7-phosphate isomerase